MQTQSAQSITCISVKIWELKVKARFKTKKLKIILVCSIAISFVLVDKVNTRKRKILNNEAEYLEQ